MDLSPNNPWIKYGLDKLYEWLPGQLGKLKPDFGRPTTNRYLAKLLRDKYGGTHFHLIRNQQKFYQAIGKTLVSAIKQQRDKPNEQLGSHQIRVGIVCGPMVYRAGIAIAQSQLASEGDDFEHVSFVAMNKAAERDAFQYSANYLVAFLSSLFPHSHSIAYTFNGYDHDAIAVERRSPNILLCSAGAYLSSPKSYLQLWCERAIPGFLEGSRLGPTCVGDFCLTPIDSGGRTISGGNILDAIYNGLDPWPRFKNLSDHTFKGCHVILPINVEPDSSRGISWTSPKPIPTGKEAIAKAVLRSGIVSDCLLERHLARNLAFAVGDYLLDSASEYQVDRPLRLCKVHDFRSGPGLRDIYVYDPLGRLDSACRVIPGDRSQPISLSIIPQIIISETQGELKSFDWDSQEGVVSITIDGKTFDILVHAYVRKPGQIPLLILQSMARQIERIQKTRRRVKIWDVGCGTGFLGLLTMRLLGDKIEAIRSTDISANAVDCTRANIARLKVDDSRIQVEQADLFAGAVPTDSHDLIVFNPPFLPDGLPGIHSIDSGGPSGIETALRFSEEVGRFIQPGGSALLTIPEYVDDGRIWKQLSQEFGPGHVECDERLILYPYDTPNPIPRAAEISLQGELEKKTGHRFETCFIGKSRFIAFTLRHYCATKVAATQSPQSGEGHVEMIKIPLPSGN